MSTPLWDAAKFTPPPADHLRPLTAQEKAAMRKATVSICAAYDPPPPREVVVEVEADPVVRCEACGWVGRMHEIVDSKPARDARAALCPACASVGPALTIRLDDNPGLSAAFAARMRDATLELLRDGHTTIGGDVITQTE